MRQFTKVLSIDWDYFFNCTDEVRVMNFPDPNDELPLSLNTIIWGSRYSQEQNLEEVGVTKTLYKSMLRYLNELRRNPVFSARVMITNSHKYLYDFMTESYEVCPVNMVHIDYHTDTYGLRDEVDCGNWVNHMYEHEVLKNSTVHWIGRKDSEVDANPLSFFITEEPIENTNKDLGQTITNLFNGETPDMIFLCKSCPWSPPHLDKKFDLLVDELKHMRGNIKYSNDIKNRWTKQFQDCVHQEREQFNKIYNS